MLFERSQIGDPNSLSYNLQLNCFFPSIELVKLHVQVIMSRNGDNVSAQADFNSLDIVTAKVPASWSDFPEALFIQIEALKGVSVSSKKFYYCVSFFKEETANQVLDLI